MGGCISRPTCKKNYKRLHLSEKTQTHDHTITRYQEPVLSRNPQNVVLRNTILPYEWDDYEIGDNDVFV